MHTSLYTLSAIINASVTLASGHEVSQKRGK